MLTTGRVFLPNWNVKDTAFVTGYLGLVTEILQPNSPRWLCASLSSIPGVSLDAHIEAFTKLDPGEDSLWSSSPITADLWWKDSNWTRSIKVHVNQACLERFWTEFGDPGDTGAWLAARLLPRLLSGAIRRNPPLIQLWARL